MLWKNAEDKSWSENLNGKMRYCYFNLRLTRPDSCGICPPLWWLRHPRGMLKGGEWSPRL